MALITIRERLGARAGPAAAAAPEARAEFRAALSFDGEGEVTVADPFSKEQEALLEWYFEEHLRFPFVRQVDAEKAAAAIAAHGEALFGQLFADPEAHARYRQEVRAGLDTLRFEVAGSPELHALHWEAEPSCSWTGTRRERPTRWRRASWPAC